jgi:transposase-like protein
MSTSQERAPRSIPPKFENAPSAWSAPPGPSSDERERLKTLEGENKELRRANEILCEASAFFAQAELVGHTGMTHPK